MCARAGRVLVLWTVLSIAFTACATNPATGEQQLSLISRDQEVQMGREAAAEVRRTIGFVDDRALQTYVARVGRKLAADSERPSLPWEFHVVNDPAPNAFALPGGFIYVTRGMMNLMVSEAQLAGVLGHEIGHVTARDSVNQISRQQLAQLGLGLGGILFPDVRSFEPLLGSGLDLLFLKYGRDDEREADKLGFEYMRRAGYDVSALSGVFSALERSGGSDSALPTWLATHPSPGERVQTAEQRAATAGPQRNARVGRDDYLQQIDGLVYGKDPRDGFFRERVFYHPALRFSVAFPGGWTSRNLTQAVVSVAPGDAAVLQLTLVEGETPAAALTRFLGQSGIRAGARDTTAVHGQPAALAVFQAATEQGSIQGLAGFIAYQSRVYRIIGYTSPERYARFSQAFEAAIRSFAPVADPQILSVQADRMDVVRVPSGMTMAEFARRYRSAVPADRLAVLNQLPGERSAIEAGTLVKRVVK